MFLRGTTKAWPNSTRVEIRIEHGGAHEFVIVCFDAAEVNKERGFALHQRTIQIHVVLANLKRRAFAGIDRKRVTRIEALVVEVERCATAQLVSAGSSQDVDARGRLIVLGRKRVLIDANLANGVFRRHVAAGETVDKDLPAVWSH